MNNLLKHCRKFIYNQNINNIVFKQKALIDLENIIKKLSMENKHIFGVFVTIERSKMHSLNKWPENIHGCLGYSNKNFTKINKDDLLTKIEQLCYDSATKDSRKNYFKDLKEDKDAIVKISLMITPIFNVNTTTGILSNKEDFNNNIYGLIYQSASSGATYLPKVFDNKSWIEIRDSLINKSGGIGKNNSSDKFYAYKTKELKTFINKTVQFKKTKRNSPRTNFKTRNTRKNNNKDFNNQIKTLVASKLKKIALFFKIYYTEFIPYMYRYNNIEIDKTQFVRNIASMKDIFTLNKHTPVDNKVIINVNKNVEEMKIEYEKNPKRLRQSAGFLLLILYKNYHENKDLINNIERHLYRDLDLMEKDFELGEILMSLCKIGKKSENFNLKEIKRKQLEIYYNELKSSKTQINDIFRFNWHLQFLHYFNKLKNQNLQHKLQNHFNILYEKVIYINKSFNHNTETNYLVVMLESLCVLYRNMKQKKTVLKKMIKNLISKLNKRFYQYLYAFLNKESRIDITGHFINAIDILIS